MKTEIVNVTPDLASEWLDRNQGNRNLRMSRVAAMAEDMRAGTWQLTHQGIAFDEDGNLLDGQHRLAAVVKSGETVQMMVTTGLKRGEVMAVLDSGLVRAAEDSLRFLHNGDPLYCNTATAIIRFLFLTRNSRRRMTVSQIDSALTANREMVQYLLQIKHKNQMLTPASVLVAIAGALIFGVSKDDIERFCALAFRNVLDPETPAATQKAVLDYARTITRKGTASLSDRMNTYEATQNAIYCFVHQLKRLRRSDTLPYPIRLNSEWKIVRD